MNKTRYEISLADQITGEELQIIRDVLIGKHERPCMMCKEPTLFIDIASEGRVCSKYCNDEFYERLDNHTRKHLGIEE